MNIINIYKAIEQIAQVCFSQGVLMTFDALAAELARIFNQKFASGRGMARRVSTAYEFSSKTSKRHDSIAKVFVKKNGQYAY